MSVDGSTAPSAAVLAEAANAVPADGQEQQQAPNQVQPKQDDKFASKFAALARKEKELRDTQGRFVSEKQKLEQDRAEMEAWKAQQKSEREAILAEVKANPLKWLQENAGYGFEELTKMQLNEQNPTPEMLIKRTRDELESSYKKDLEQLRQSMKEKEEQEEKKQYDQTVTGFKSQINDFLTANSEAYELIQVNEAQDLVFDVIQEFYNSSQRILSIEEAAKHVEEHLETEARKILEAKKFKQPSNKPSEEHKTTPTLSNTLASEVPVTGAKKLSREESLANAAKMIRWQQD